MSSLDDDFLAAAAPFLLLFVLSALADDFADLIRGNETLDAADRDSDRDDFLDDFFDSFDFFDSVDLLDFVDLELLRDARRSSCLEAAEPSRVDDDGDSEVLVTVEVDRSLDFDRDLDLDFDLEADLDRDRDLDDRDRDLDADLDLDLERDLELLVLDKERVLLDEPLDDVEEERADAIVVELFFVNSRIVRLSRESVLNQSSHAKL